MAYTDPRKAYIKEHLSIPDYFNAVILPECPDYYSHSNPNLEAYPKILCPLHDEDTASFHYNPNYESFRCYGCDTSGDVLTLHYEFMLRHYGKKLPWNEVISELYKMAKTGETVAQPNIFKTKIKDEVLNSNADILHFKILLNRWLRTLQTNPNLTQEAKYELIKEIDTVRSGVLGQGISTKEASKTINELFSKLIII